MSERRIKCLVWDLDQTLWSGILLEGDRVALQPGVRETIVALDGRGILQSIASQNDPALAIGRLTTWGLADYFLYPQISLTVDKPAQIAHVAHLLNLQLEHVAFIDDDPSKRAYVVYTLPAVTVLEADQAPILPQTAMFAVDHLTEEARHRRQFYQAEVQRQAAERSWHGRRLDFLRYCHTVLVLRAAAAKDVPRIAELIERTNQLNTAAYRFSYKDVARRMNSPEYCLVVAQMSDRFGDYGTVGVMIIHQLDQQWWVEVLLVSCRVMGRGVGEALLCYGLQQARATSLQSLHALYRRTAYNRAMHLLFVTHGFRRGKEEDEMVAFTHDLEFIPDYPTWIDVQVT